MLVKTHARNLVLPDTLAEHVDAKIRLALGLYREKIRRVDIFLSDVNGPKGGEDIMCKIKIKADGHAPLIAQATATSIYDAMNICSQRIKRSVSRRFDRVLQRYKGASERYRSNS